MLFLMLGIRSEGEMDMDWGCFWWNEAGRSVSLYKHWEEGERSAGQEEFIRCKESFPFIVTLQGMDGI